MRGASTQCQVSVLLRRKSRAMTVERVRRVEEILGGALVRLEALTREHEPFLYRLCVGGSVGFRWRYLGAMVSPETFHSQLWNGILSQFVVVKRSDGSTIGQVLAYQPDLHAGVAHIGVIVVPELAQRGFGSEATILFADYLFSLWDLRKLYVEIPEFNMYQFQSLSRFCRKEATHLQDFYLDGRLWDKYMFSITRHEFDSAFGRLLRH